MPDFSVRNSCGTHFPPGISDGPEYLFTTSGVAVAVNARIGTPGRSSRISAIFRYAGRKSYPHCDIQWLSSTVIMQIFIYAIWCGIFPYPAVREKYRGICNCRICSFRVWYDDFLPRHARVDGKSFDSPLPQVLYLIFHQGNNGVMTRQILLWRVRHLKVIDLPPPVGISPKVSLPSVILLMISSCDSRKVSYPRYSSEASPQSLPHREGSFEVTTAAHGLIELSCYFLSLN